MQEHRHVGLADLDELMLRCKDSGARANVEEAVACIRVGAFRAAIVMTWVAVLFDLVHKLRDLKAAGDKGAEKVVDEFDEIQLRKDARRSQEFERTILDVATRDFELLAPMERDDLARLQTDRNRCAHPTMQSAEENFRPTPELARTHLRHAVEYLISQPAMQGKAALNSITSLVSSDYFPTNVTTAVIQLRGTALRKPRTALLRNFLAATSAALLRANEKEFDLRKVAALNAARELHHARVNEFFASELSRRMRGLDDAHLPNALFLIAKVDDALSHLDEDIVKRIGAYVAKMPDDDLFDCMPLAVESAEAFASDIRTRMKSVRSDTLAKLIATGGPHPLYVPRALFVFYSSAIGMPFLGGGENTSKHRTRPNSGPC